MKNTVAIQDALEPNINPAHMKELYVDTGDFNRLLDRLSGPKTFLVYGDRGAGKTLLFNLLKTEFLAKVAEHYENTDFLNAITEILYFKRAPRKRAIFPVFMRITNSSGSQSHKELLFDMVHEIMKNTAKTLLLAKEVSKGKILRGYETQLVTILAALESKETTYVTGKRLSFRYDIGGKVLPIQLSEESSEDFSKAVTSRTVQDLRSLHSIGDELVNIAQKEGIELVVTLDEFDKIPVPEAAAILRAEQGPLFEALRPQFSFLIPATEPHVTEMEKAEYLGVFTSKPFDLTPFDLEHTKEMIDKRLDFHKPEIGEKIAWKDIVREKKLSEVIEKAGHVPRRILKELQTEISAGKKLPIG